jgi:hypothetical protein
MKVGQVFLRLRWVGWSITVISHLSPLAGLRLLNMAKFEDLRKA